MTQIEWCEGCTLNFHYSTCSPSTRNGRNGFEPPIDCLKDNKHLKSVERLITKLQEDKSLDTKEV